MFSFSVETFLSSSSDVIDIVLETTDSENLQLGEFILPEGRNDYNKNNKSLEVVEDSDWKNDGKASLNHDINYLESDEAFDEGMRARNSCDKNVVYQKFSINQMHENERVSWFWTIRTTNDNISTKGANNSVNFR